MRKQFSQKGFTLLELVVAIGIFLLLGVGFASILVVSLRTNDIVWNQLESQNDARHVLQEVVDDVRRAESSSIGSYAIVTSTAYEFAFYANVDSDSLREEVRFWLDGDILKKGVTKPAGNPLVYNAANEEVRELAHSVVNITEGVNLFEYFDETYEGVGSGLVDPIDMTAIRSVRVSLEIEKDPDKSPEPFHAETFVQIRNLKTN